MEIDAKLLKKVEELKKQLEGISGQKIDASPEQLIPLFFRVSLLTSEDGVIMSRSLIFPGKSCTPRSSRAVRRCGASSAKSCGDNVARKRLNDPWSSCRARGGVLCGIAMSLLHRKATRSSFKPPDCRVGPRERYQLKTVDRRVPVCAAVITDAAKTGAIARRASDTRH